jgi:hypothetical protein
MPRYFFCINHDVDSSNDDGLEFPDDTAAWNAATRAAGEMLRDMNFRPGDHWQMEVKDDRERMLFQILISTPPPKT